MVLNFSSVTVVASNTATLSLTTAPSSMLHFARSVTGATILSPISASIMLKVSPLILKTRIFLSSGTTPKSRAPTSSTRSSMQIPVLLFLSNLFKTSLMFFMPNVLTRAAAFPAALMLIGSCVETTIQLSHENAENVKPRSIPAGESSKINSKSFSRLKTRLLKSSFVQFSGYESGAAKR